MTTCYAESIRTISVCHCSQASPEPSDRQVKREYDFLSAVRGKFFRKGAELNFPIYVDGPRHKRLERLAKRKGKPVTDLVNQLLKRDLELLESLSSSFTLREFMALQPSIP